MRHKKTSLLISSLLLTVYILLLAFFLYSKSVAAVLPLILVSYEGFRMYRKVQLIKNGPKTQWRLQSPIKNHYYSAWYRFADSTEQDYMAEKFQQTIKKIRRK